MHDPRPRARALACAARTGASALLLALATGHHGLRAQAQGTQESASSVVARITATEAGVQLHHGDSAQRAPQRDAALNDGDTLATGEGRARIELTITDGAGMRTASSIALGPNTVLTLRQSQPAPDSGRPADTDPRITVLAEGGIHWTGTVSSQARLLPVLRAARAWVVAHGTDFIATYDPYWDNVALYLRDGRLSIHLPDSVHELAAGQAVSIFQGRLSQITPLEEQAWLELATTIDGSGSAIAVDVTYLNLPTGPLGRGDGSTQRDGTTFEITGSTGLSTWFPIALERGISFTASALIAAPPNGNVPALAGLYLSDQTEADCAEGDVFFGRNARGFVLQQCLDGAWSSLPRSAAVTPAADGFDRLEIERRGNAYRFRVNGADLASTELPDRAADNIFFFVGPGGRGILRDWKVTQYR
jgi:hypothetical protein